MNNKHFNLIPVLILILISLFLVNVAQATTVPVPDPLSHQADNIPLLVGNVIKYILSILGVLALVMFISGGIMWMTSGGVSDKIKKGRDTLVWAILGLALIFFSYGLLNFILGALQQS